MKLKDILKEMEYQILNLPVKDYKGKTVKIPVERYGRGIFIDDELFTYGDHLYDLYSSVYTGKSSNAIPPTYKRHYKFGSRLVTIEVYNDLGISNGIIINNQKIPWKEIFKHSQTRYDI